MNNPIITREFFGLLQTRKALAMLVGLAVVCSLLVIARWPTDARVDLSMSQSGDVFRVFAYGLLTLLLLIVPAFPATSIVREKQQGTMQLLFNSPMSPWSIYLGKLLGELAFVMLMLLMSVPAAAACFAMGGIALTQQLLALYAILFLVAVQYSALGLLVSTYTNSTDSALRIMYGLVLLLALLTLGPHLFLQGSSSTLSSGVAWLRLVSPIPAVMEILGAQDQGSQGLGAGTGAPLKYALLALITTLAFMTGTVIRFNYTMFDRTRSQGTVTQDRGWLMRMFRRIWFLVDPQRRKAGIPSLANPIMVKEFRSRRFGRLHWLLRLVAVCALISIGLTFATTTGSIAWGRETVGMIMVVLQVALIVLVTPSLGAGLISSERESGSWQQLQMTPLSAGRIVSGKLMSVIATLVLILLATLPGYAVIIAIEPRMRGQVSRVLVCLVLMAVFAILSSAAISSLFRKTAVATATAYTLLVGICAGTMLVWFARDRPFGHSTVEAALVINPMAAALHVVEAENFANYNLLPANWWFIGMASVFCLVVLTVQTWRLTKPQ